MSEAEKDWGTEALRSQVHALRSHASLHPDPVRLHYLEALARRLQSAPPAVQKVLQAKLEEALKSIGGGEDAVAPFAPRASTDPTILNVHPEPIEVSAPTLVLRKPKPKIQLDTKPNAAPLSLLGQLNQHIQNASKHSEMGPPQAAVPVRKDLKSAIRFRETWARISAESEVDKAANRAPENAGPLNAHNLVLRTLGLMRELSPDYLRRFLSHTETLLWLDQAHGQLKQPAGKAKTAKGGKPKA